MLSHNGCQKLREFTERSYKKTVMEVNFGRVVRFRLWPQQCDFY